MLDKLTEVHMTAEEKLAEIERIITSTEWDAAARIAYATLRLQAYKQKPQGNYFVMDDLTEDKFAELTGLSKNTAGKYLRKLDGAGLITRDTSRDTYNRYGQPIPKKSASPDRGDHWQTTVVTSLKVTPLSDLPATLPELKSDEKARQRAAKITKLAKIGKELLETACPECGAVGKWHLACGECGTTWTAEELAAGTSDPAQTLCRNESPAQGLCSNERNTEGGGLNHVGIIEGAPLSGSEPEVGQIDASHVGAQTLVCDSLAGVQFAPPDPSDAGAVSSFRPSVEVLTGAVTIDYLAGVGASFCFVQPRGKAAINMRDDEGHEFPWQSTPVDAQAACRYLARGGNVGLLCGRGNLVLLDIDGALDDFLTRYPHLAGLPRFMRQNAPDRAKLLALVSDDAPTRHCKGLHSIDLLGAGAHGVVVGTHHTGAAIEFHPGDLAVFTFAQLEAIAREWAGLPDTSVAVRAAANVLPHGDLLRAAFQWGNQTYLTEVQSLIAQCPQRGGYIALRLDDDTPSARASRDSYAQMVKATWRDYGSGETLDAVELYCRLKGLDKRTFKWQLVNEYLAAHGKRPLRLRSV